MLAAQFIQLRLPQAVQLDEGPRLVGYMVNCTPERMRFGMKVRVLFKPLTDDVTLPVWEPV